MEESINFLSVEIIITFITTTITILSTVVGCWQYTKSRKTKKLMIYEAITIHNNVAMVLGAIQNVKKNINNGESSKFEIGRAEGLSQAILHESAKLYCNLSNTTNKEIDSLVKNHKLKEEYNEIYYSYSHNK